MLLPDKIVVTAPHSPASRSTRSVHWSTVTTMGTRPPGQSPSTDGRGVFEAHPINRPAAIATTTTTTAARPIMRMIAILHSAVARSGPVSPLAAFRVEFGVVLPRERGSGRADARAALPRYD